ncbi:MAG: aspartate aminotransferase family protein [Rhodospirillales bacterium]|nr:aspartate aminotransferase family protein [Rhodospirillales bacterium]
MRMALDLAGELESRRGEGVSLFDRHLNSQLVQVLKTIGFDIDYVRGEGPYLYDAAGLRYLDLLSGFGVFAVGRSHPTVIAALEQVLTAHLPNLVQLDVSLLAGLLAERLVARMPDLEKVFFCNSGAEAVEAAIKFSRTATGRSRVVYCDHAFHGLTYGALSLNGDEVFRKGFAPFLGDCVRVPFNDVPALERALAGGDVAAFIFEPIQGKGVNVPDNGYLAAAQDLCRKHRTLLIADEIQTGIGRTGRFLACEHWAVEPDMVLLAKALSGGFVPVGAVVMRREIFNRMFDRMDRAVVHGSTFARNDLAMAAGLATLSVLDDERLIERTAELGERLIAALRRRFAGDSLVREVRGKGMMIGLEFGPPDEIRLKAAYALMEKASRGLFCQLLLMPLLRRHRILAQVAGPNMPVIKLLPSLVIGEADLTWIEDALADVIGEAHKLGSMWDLGRMLVSQAAKARAGAI